MARIRASKTASLMEICFDWNSLFLFANQDASLNNPISIKRVKLAHMVIFGFKNERV